MTKEQAIAMLKAKRECIELDTNGNAELCDRNCGECKLNYEQGNMGEQKIVLDIAIKALEQQPSGDCVSRKEVINQIFYSSDNNSDVVVSTRLMKRIKALSPVTPTRKKGEWCKQNDDYFDWYECSECGYGSEGEMQYSSECDVRTKYCPNCGAKMI